MNTTTDAGGSPVDCQVRPGAEACDFLPHHGGPVPFQAGTRVDLLHRDGSLSFERAVQVRDQWAHLGTPCDIVGYRQSRPRAPHFLLGSKIVVKQWPKL
jgi:hypothetical protein